MRTYALRNVILLLILAALFYFFVHITGKYRGNLQRFNELKEIIFSSQPPGLDTHGKDLVGRIFKNFTLTDLDGNSWELHKIEARIKIIILFTTFDCAKCLLEYRLWNDIQAKYPPDEVTILGVAFSPNREGILEFVSNKNIKFPVLFDRKDSVKSGMGFSTTPLRITLDSENRIVEIKTPHDSIENHLHTLDKIESWLSSGINIKKDKSPAAGFGSKKP